MSQRLIHLAVFLGVIFLVFLVYYPGIHGPYVLDDEENITLNNALAITDITLDSISNAVLSNQSGPFKRPLASLSFALNHYFAGGFENTQPLKITNVAIHLTNGLLIYYFSLLLLRRKVFAHKFTIQQRIYVAAFAALLWVLHPIQLTSVLYVVQRMTSLSALFVILGLIVFMHGRQSLEESRKIGFVTMFVGVIGGALLGCGAKENAVLLPLFALVIELTIYRRDGLILSIRKRLWIFYLLTVAAPLVVFILYVLTHPDFFFSSYSIRSFSPYERILTESRVLWFYLSLLIVPSIYRLGLFHDDFTISTSLLQPITTLTSVIGIAAILILALLKFRRFPLISFSIIWFFAGHSLESSIFGLEIAYEHRNYLPSFGPIFAAAFAIFVILSRLRSQLNKTSIAMIPIAIILIFGFSTWTWANYWKDTSMLATFHAKNHPNSPRTNNFAAYASIRESNDITSAIEYTSKGIEIAPEEVGFHLDMQIFLAYLASEINSRIAKSQVDTSNKFFHISDLPKYIQSRNYNGKLHLVYNRSDKKLINELLRHKPISVHGVVVLDKLTTCIIEKVPHCQSLQEDAIEWLASASSNMKTSLEYRALIAANCAKLYANIGNYPLALNYITSASKIFPNTPYYQFGRAEYLIRLGQLNESELVLNRIEITGISYEKDLKTLKLLREMQRTSLANFE